MNQLFQTFLASRSRSKSTQKVYASTLLRFGGHCEAQSLSVLNCKAEDLEAYHQSLLWASRPGGGLYSPNTVYLVLRTLREFYRWAAAEHLVDVDPAAGWSFSRPIQPDQPSLTREQALALLSLPDLSQAGGQRDQLFLELTYTLGLSLAHCLALDVDWEDRFDPVRASWDRYVEHGRNALARVDSPPALLLTAYGRPYTTQAALRTILQRYGQALGLPFKLSPLVLQRSAREHRESLARRHSRAMVACAKLDR
jgi:integrase/recombinase XerD